MLDISTLGDAADVNPVTNQVPATHVQRVWQELDYRIDICSDTKGGHIEHLLGRTKVGVSLPLLKCSPSA